MAYPESLFSRYRSKGILIDTNLLVLIAVGTYQRSRIPTFKRTIQYSLEDFDLMLRIATYFQRRIITPNILTEVDNLARQLPEAEHEQLAKTFNELIASQFEVYVRSMSAAQHHEYSRLGLTDCTSALAAFESSALLITDDLRLSNIVSNLGMDVININHIRTLNW